MTDSNTDGREGSLQCLNTHHQRRERESYACSATCWSVSMSTGKSLNPQAPPPGRRHSTCGTAAWPCQLPQQSLTAEVADWGSSWGNTTKHHIQHFGATQLFYYSFIYLKLKASQFRQKRTCCHYHMIINTVFSHSS